jgi:hypothetical protein
VLDDAMVWSVLNGEGCEGTSESDILNFQGFFFLLFFAKLFHLTNNARFTYEKKWQTLSFFCVSVAFDRNKANK